MVFLLAGLLSLEGCMEDREIWYREAIATLACAIANGEDWDLQTVAGFLHMGNEQEYYVFADPPPAQITREQVVDAVDTVFEQAGW